MGAKRRPGNEGEGGVDKSPDNVDNVDNVDHERTAPAPKRQRVSRACDQCRSAREKCDGIQPLCFPCASQNRRCTWEEPKKKRGVQTGYIRTLEMALGWIFDKIPRSEEALHSLLTHEGGQGRSLLVEKDNTGDRLHRRWRKSTVHREIDRVLSGGDVAVAKSTNESPPGDESDEETEKNVLSTHQPLSSPAADASIASKAGDERLGLPDTEPLKDDHDTPSTARNAEDASHNPMDLQRRHQEPEPLKLPPNYWRLLDIYFSYTHSWFPVLERHDALKTAYTYPDEGLQMSVLQRGTSTAGHAELWAALALASYQEEASKTAGPLHEALVDRTTPLQIYQAARNLLPSEDGPFEVHHVNALLLLTLVNLARANLTAAWLLVGSASRLALRLELDKSTTSERSRRSHHTYMGCFILDTLLSARLGLQPHLKSDVSQVAADSLANDLDEWQPWVPCSGFGPQQGERLHSRVPSHSVSSFGMLYSMHRIMSYRLFAKAGAPSQQEDMYLAQLQGAITSCDAHRPSVGFILGGEPSTGQLPSVHLLRLAFLAAASYSQAFPYLLMPFLGCLESYVANFGVCGMPPLVSTYMELVSQQGMLGAGERERWKQIEAAIASVWKPSTYNHDEITSNHSHSRPNPPPPPLPLQASNDLLLANTPQMTPQRLLTTALYNTNSAMEHTPPALVNSYSQGQTTNVLDFSDHAPTPSESDVVGLNRPSGIPSGEVAFDHMDMPGLHASMHFPAHARPSFSSNSLDYDSILDDIASMDRTDMMESDPQFMANLGLRPGTNLAEVFSHEFMGFS
ncbi:Uu.00g024980.m01.CDS01 [Anthostomella pinea]|uniref:Uu.00g024980.m01.CDS01 n=1 Tax=Anthostomella pinea TaxID=933095 RepID=A0AAI8V892_9PEZI|nr:Uu.00g024980.m01.CDS01 [Anthostomella pinea]